MEVKDQKIISTLFVLVVIINIILRFYGFDSWSFTNDELSALFRLNFDSLSSLMDQGIKVDGHPALVQLFLYFWSFLFGTSEFAIRLPFVLAGIAGSIYFYYFIKDFVNPKAAILAFAALTFSQLFILYSQIARPYSIGFFLVCSFAFYWFRLIKHPDKRKYMFGFIITGFLGIISHYFASMSISLILVFGLFFFNRKNMKAYCISGLAICILFIPHIGITKYQLGIGGVSWLPPPTENFIYEFLLFVFNGSNLWQYLIFAFPLIAFLSSKTNFTQWRIYLLPLLFIVPYYIAYKYSLSKTPVMQFSVLIFAVPFFIAFLFSFFSKKSNSIFISALTVIIICSGLYSLLQQRDFYNKKAFADFKGVSQHVSQWTEELGAGNIIRFSNSNNPEYLNYYYNKDSSQIKFEIEQFEDLSYTTKARDLIKNSSTDYALVSFANVPVPAEVYEFVKQKYPELWKQHVHFNSDASLFKKSNWEREKVFATNTEMNAEWNIDGNLRDTSTYFSSPNAYHINPNVLYSLSYSDTIKNIFPNNNNYVVVSGQAFMNIPQEAKLVFSVERGTESIYWRGMDIQSYYSESEWFQFLYVFGKDIQVQENDLVKIYIWNPAKSDFYIDDFSIVNYADSDYNYYEL